MDGFDVKRSHCHLVEGRPNDAIPRAVKRERFKRLYLTLKPLFAA